MDFKLFKKNVSTFTKKLKNKKEEVTENLAKKFSNSTFVLKNKKELDEFIKKSKNHTMDDGRVFKKRVLVIFGDSKTNFYKETLSYFPILFTKSWSSNTSIRLIDINIEDIKKEDYNFDFIPSLVVYENKSFLKVIPGRNNIIKIVKNTTMDIEKLVDDIELDKPEIEEIIEEKVEEKEENKK